MESFDVSDNISCDRYIQMRGDKDKGWRSLESMEEGVKFRRRLFFFINLFFLKVGVNGVMGKNTVMMDQKGKRAGMSNIEEVWTPRLLERSLLPPSPHRI